MRKPTEITLFLVKESIVKDRGWGRWVHSYLLCHNAERTGWERVAWSQRWPARWPVIHPHGQMKSTQPIWHYLKQLYAGACSKVPAGEHSYSIPLTGDRSSTLLGKAILFDRAHSFRRNTRASVREEEPNWPLQPVGWQMSQPDDRPHIQNSYTLNSDRVGYSGFL